MKRATYSILFLILNFMCYAQAFDFEADTTKGCAPLKATYINTTPDSIKNNYSYEWIVEAGKFSTQTDSVQNTYLMPGRYTATMKVYDVSKKLVSSITKKDYITVYNDPDVIITSDKTSTCEDKEFNFSIVSLTADTTISSYSWILSDGTIYQSEIPPAHIFGFAEDFTVFLSVIDDHGCTNRERKTISVKTYNDYPEVMMSSDRSRSCDPQLDVKFSNFTEDENVVSFFWDFGDGTTYTGKTPPTHHYSGYNTYRATLQAVSKNDCISYSAKNIQLVNFQPEINFDDNQKAVTFNTTEIKRNMNTETPFMEISNGESKTKYCPGTISFSVPNSDYEWTYEWDFENDGIIDSEADTYEVDIDEGGTYTIKLTVSNGICTKELVKTFEVESPLTITATPTKDFYCKLPAEVDFVANSNIDGTQFYWAISDSSFYQKQSFTKNFTHEDIYSSKLFAISPNYCSAELSLPNNVETSVPTINHIADATYPSPRSGCVPLDVRFTANYKYNTDSDSIDFFMWDFDNDGTVDEKTYFDSKKKSGSVGVNWTYNNVGVYAYEVSLQTQKGCVVRNFFVHHKKQTNYPTVYDSVSVGDVPFGTIDFPDEICSSEKIQVDISLDDANKYKSIYDTLNVYFTILNNSSSTTEFPIPSRTSVTITDTIGVHNVSYVISDNGCKQNFTNDKTILFKGPYIELDTLKTSCEHSLKHQYSFKKNYGSTSWEWYLKKYSEGDYTLIANDVDYIDIDYANYGGRGNYIVKVTAHNSETGCNMSDSLVVQVTDLQADFGLKTYEPCYGDQAVFVVSPEMGQDIVSWTWIYDWHGKKDSLLFATYNPWTEVLKRLDDSDTVRKYVFDYEDIDHVTVLVKDIMGCEALVQKPVKVYRSRAGFYGDVLSDCLPFITNFTDTSRSENEIVQRTWELGNNEKITGNETTVQTEYNTKGNKHVVLTIVDDHGCTDKATMGDYIKPVVPNAQFTVTNEKLCLGTEAVFKRNLRANGYANTLTHYAWDFGDETIQEFNGNAPETTTYLYNTPSKNKYDVKLIAYCISPEGHECVDTATNEIDIKDVKAKITVRNSDKCKEPGQKFIVYLDISSYTSNITNFDWWKTENGDSIYVSNKRTLQVITFDNYGEQSLHLRTKSRYFGCEETKTTLPVMVPGYEATMQALKTDACVHEEIPFVLSDTFNLYRYNAYWEFGDGVSVPLTELTETHFYEALAGTDDNTYKVQFIVDAEGCKPRDISANITVYPVMADFTRGPLDLDTLACAPYSVKLYNTSQTGGNKASYLWDLGDGTTTDEENPTIKIKNPNDTISVSLLVTSNICNDRKTKRLISYPVASLNVEIDSTICYGENISAKATGDFTSIEWLPHKIVSNPYGSETDISVKQSQYVFIKTNSTQACSHIDSTFIYVQQKPRYFGAPDSVLIFYGSDGKQHRASEITNNIIAGQVYNVNTTMIQGMNYTWQPATYLSCTYCPSPDLDLTCGKESFEDCLTFPEFIEYTITMEDTLGCFTSDTTIRFNILIDTKIGMPEAFTPNGDGINDIALVRGWGIREFVEVKIYNRWGQLVFESDDMSKGWDGTFKGEPQGMDTFAYTISAVNMKGEDIFVKGYITLIR